MNKAQILQETTKAKIAHKRWVKRASHLISGLPVDKEFIPLDATACGFGLWLYGQGTALRNMDLTKYIIEEIEHHHDDLHEAYGEIYRLYFMLPENRSFLTKMMTFNSKKITQKEKDKASEYFKQLSRSSEELLALLDRLEKATDHLNYTDMNN